MDAQNLTPYLTLILNNQAKILAGQQVLMIQQTRLVAALTNAQQIPLMEEYDAIFQTEHNKSQLAILSELRGLQGLPRSDHSGGFPGMPG